MWLCGTGRVGDFIQKSDQCRLCDHVDVAIAHRPARESPRLSDRLLGRSKLTEGKLPPLWGAWHSPCGWAGAAGVGKSSLSGRLNDPGFPCLGGLEGTGRIGPLDRVSRPSLWVCGSRLLG